MSLKNIRLFKRWTLDQICLLAVFSLTWLGFGVYTSVLLVVVFILFFFFKQRRAYLLEGMRDRPFIVLLSLFVLNNVISSLLSIDRGVSSSLSILWFALIFLPVVYTRYALSEQEGSFIRAVVPAGFFISVIVVAYLALLYVRSLFAVGHQLHDYSFYFMSEGSTPDMIVMLGGIGYGWLKERGGRRGLWLGFLYLLFCSFGIILTGDRGGGVAFFVLTMILLVFDYRRLILFFVIIAAVIAVSMSMDSLWGIRRFYEYIFVKSIRDYVINVGQIFTFKVAWYMIRDHWLLGVGTNNFWALSDLYGGEKFAYAHNIVLQFWAENGLFGMLFGLSIIGIFIYRWIKSYKLYRFRHIAFGMGASFIAMLVAQLTNCTIWAFQSAIPFWLLAGTINAIYYNVEKPEINTSHGT
jgi:O-antigen ligase